MSLLGDITVNVTDPEVTAPLRQARTARGLSLSKLAHEMGISVSSIYKFEKRGLPDAVLAAKLAARFPGLTLEQVCLPWGMSATGGRKAREKKAAR